VRGEDHIPERETFVLVANHYERPGLWMAWPAVYLSTLVLARARQDIHWIAIQEWESYRIWGVHVPPGVTRVVFERTYRAYGILAMAPAAAPAGARAASMRAALQEVRKGHIVGIMPEGDVGPTPEMLEAREGAGTFLLMMAAAGARILPSGLFEEDGRLVVRIGEAFDLRAPGDVPRDERDRWARDLVMRRVRDLLPEPLWGVYR
jgi:1-acyl-sn-glycerol-3-phosphate acyltransferase